MTNSFNSILPRDQFFPVLRPRSGRAFQGYQGEWNHVSEQLIALAEARRGHATDHAFLLGWGGELADDVAPEQIEFLVEDIRGERSRLLGGSQRIPLDESAEMFHKDAGQS